MAIALKFKVRLQKLLGRVPHEPYEPYCRRRLGYLSYALLTKHNCLWKKGIILKKPCGYLLWLSFRNLCFLEIKLKELMAW